MKKNQILPTVISKNIFILDSIIQRMDMCSNNHDIKQWVMLMK